MEAEPSDGSGIGAAHDMEQPGAPTDMLVSPRQPPAGPQDAATAAQEAAVAWGSATGGDFPLRGGAQGVACSCRQEGAIHGAGQLILPMGNGWTRGVHVVLGSDSQGVSALCRNMSTLQRGRRGELAQGPAPPRKNAVFLLPPPPTRRPKKP